MHPATETPASDSLLEAAASQSRQGPLVIAFADSGYAEILMNWLVGLAVAEVRSYLVIALDAALYDFLVQRGIPAVLSPLQGDLAALWVRRINVFAALGDAGFDFIHSDVDAVWLRNPLQGSFSDPAADASFSQGTLWPPDVHERFGFVLCCGLFQLRSNLRTRGLLSDLRRDVMESGDDQVSVKRVILRRGVRWQGERTDCYRINRAGKSFLAWRSPLTGICEDGLRITLLPHHLFQRVPVPDAERPCVMHLLSPKEAAAKLREFRERGCLLLRPDWRDMAFDADSLLRLRLHD